MSEMEIDQIEDDEWDQVADDTDENPNVFKVRDPLNEPSPNIKSTRELHRLIHEGQIDLNPSYQRDVVWPENKQIRLIDSIFRNFYIPPIVFAVTTDEDGEIIRVCVDGKQRLTSIQKFFDGQIPHKDPVTGKSFWFTTSDTLRKSRLEVPEYWRQQFASKVITCVEYKNLSTENEREIFQRVQLGMALTPAEKLQAIASPRSEWISTLQARWVEDDDGLPRVVQWDTKRGRDFQNLAQLVHICHNLPTRTLVSPAKLESWLDSPEHPPQSFKDLIRDTLEEMWYIGKERALNSGFREFKERVSPVEFVFIGVLLFVMRHASHEMRAIAIYNLRTNIREKFNDVRFNSKVISELWNFIERTVKGTPGERYIAPSKTTGSSRARASKSKQKRKQDISDDDTDNNDYRPLASKGSGRKTKSRRKS